mmetsp:Transcript_56518/g.131708  ORF Transcript_56518/g.131708 Transcript_56518/m.131708 type:complete len:105 (-) Transcript_56518:142-456(-)
MPRLRRAVGLQSVTAGQEGLRPGTAARRHAPGLPMDRQYWLFDEHIEECSFAPQICRYEGCGTAGPRSQRPAHERSCSWNQQPVLLLTNGSSTRGLTATATELR